MKNYEDILREDGYLMYRTKGGSMLPLLRENRDVVLIRKKPEGRLRRYDVPLYKSQGRYILHRILRVRKNDYVIVGDHLTVKEYGITDEQILGVLELVIRDGKEIRVTDPKYRLYAHLWCDFYPIRVVLIRCRQILAGLKRRLKKLFRKGQTE